MNITSFLFFVIYHCRDSNKNLQTVSAGNTTCHLVEDKSIFVIKSKYIPCKPNVMICQACKIFISDFSEFCPRCGSQLLDHDLSTEKLTRMERQKEMLICPQCGASHTITAQVCRYDGTPLKDSLNNHKESVEPELNIVDQKEAEQNVTQRAKNYRTVGTVVASIFVLILFSVILLYFSGQSGESIYKTTTDSSERYADKQLNANNSESPENKDFSLASHEDRKARVETAKLEVEINRALRKNGVNSIYIEINTDLTAIITGSFSTKNERQKTLTILNLYEDLTGVKDDANLMTQSSKISSSQLENQIGRALKNTGIDGITVEVNSALQATLKGAVKSLEEKNKVLEIAKIFKDVKRIKDLIFVVEH